MIEKIKKMIKQLRCKHEWQRYNVNDDYKILSGDMTVEACPKCEKIKKGSRLFLRY